MADIMKILIPGTNGLPKTFSPIDKATIDPLTDAGQPISLNTSGKVDISLLPTGLGAETKTAPSTDDLAAGDYVYFYKDGATFKVALATNTSYATRAMGFVIDPVTAPANAVVYLEGLNTWDNSYSSSTMPTNVYLAATPAGKSTATIPTTTASIVQIIGTYTGSGVTFEPIVSWING